MSHTAKIEARLTDQEAIRTACQRCKIKPPETGSVRFYDGVERHGTLIRLAGWKYPVVIDQEGQVEFDNYGGHWGKIDQLNRFRQEYSAAVVEQQAGGLWMVEREDLGGGALRLRLTR